MKKISAFCWAIAFVLLGIVWGALQIILVPLATIAALTGKNKFQQWGKNCWIGKDNLMSAQTGGDPDETISSRLGKAKLKGSGWTVIANRVDLVAKEFFNDVDHCNSSIEADEGSQQVTRY